ncbi:MAG: MGH1-like glycoside hydrolase domain-containing protein, partial [Phycisphaerae bacterium]
MDKYDELQNRICSGWNHWNTRSLLSHVHLPEAFAVNLGILSYAKPGYMKEALLGREDVVPGAKAYDGSYSDLTVTYCQTTMRVQTATDGEELVILVEPEKTAHKPALLTIESGVLWNRPGTLTRDGETLTGHFDSGDIVVHTTGRCLEEPNVAAQTPYLAIPLTASVGISTGSQRSLEEIRTIIADQRTRLEESQRKYAHKSETHRAAQACLAWNLIFDPTYDRAVMPVCRIWNLSRGGYVLFCWDTFFAAWLAAMDSKDLAYANCVEVLREKTPDGFVANNTQASGRKSFDRSQPPVGSITVLELFKRYGDRWFVEETFEDLLGWNRWWTCRDYNGYLCWGSTPFEPVT